MLNITELKRRDEHDGTLYTTAFLLSFGLFLLVCALSDCTPFGDRTILDCDMSTQYTSFFSYLRTVLSGENDLSYTFSKSLGGNMLGLAAYYMLSPFNIFFALFPVGSYPELVTFVTAAKLGMCGLTMAIFLRSRSGRRLEILALSAAYGLMAYNVTYSSNIMWLDGVYSLPLIALGIDRLVQSRDIRIFTGALAYALITNFYIGYMLCLFSVLYFAYRLAAFCMERGERPGWRTVLSFALGALAAGGLAAFILLPSYAALSGTKADGNVFRFSLERLYSVKGAVGKLFCGTMTAEELGGGPPNVYCGVSVVLLAGLYFLNRNIRPSAKIASALMLAALIAGLNISGLSRVWHGMSVPASFPNRQAFIFSFMLILLAGDCLERLRDGVSLPGLAAALAACLLAIAVLFKGTSEIYSNGPCFILDAASAAALVCALARDGKKEARRLSAVTLLLLQLAGLAVNGCMIRESLSVDVGRDEYCAENFANEAATAWLREYDGSFYRIGNAAVRQDVSLLPNDAMMFGYGGLSHYSSLESRDVKACLTGLGLMHCYDYWVSYGKDATGLLSELLSVRYVLELTEREGQSPLAEANGIYIYEDPNALGMLYAADASCIGASPEGDGMLMQESMAALAAGKDFEIFRPVEATPGDVGCYSLHIVSDCTIYASFTGPESQNAEVFVNGEKVGDYFNVTYANVIKLGSFMAGDTAEVSVRVSGSTPQIESALFCLEDQAELGSWRESMSAFADGESVEKLTSSHVRWSGDVRDDCALVFTVPAEKGWTAFADGEETEIETALGIFAAVRLSGGEHTVDFVYAPPGLSAGLAVSAGTALLLTAVWLRRRKRKTYEKDADMPGGDS